MDRRRFLTQSSLAGAGLIGITGANQNRLYGLPASSLEITESVNVVVPHLFRLHLAIAGLRIEYADCCAAVSRLAVDILQDPSSAENFVNDPDGYLEQAGFVGSSFNINTPEFRIALIWSDPVNLCTFAGLLLSLLLLLAFIEDKTSSSRGGFERRLISLIFAGRNRIILIRRELPLTRVASPAEPVA